MRWTEEWEGKKGMVGERGGGGGGGGENMVEGGRV